MSGFVKAPDIVSSGRFRRPLGYGNRVGSEKSNSRVALIADELASGSVKLSGEPGCPKTLRLAQRQPVHAFPKAVLGLCGGARCQSPKFERIEGNSRLAAAP